MKKAFQNIYCKNIITKDKFHHLFYVFLINYSFKVEFDFAYLVMSQLGWNLEWIL